MKRLFDVDIPTDLSEDKDHSLIYDRLYARVLAVLVLPVLAFFLAANLATGNTVASALVLLMLGSAAVFVLNAYRPDPGKRQRRHMKIAIRALALFFSAYLVYSVQIEKDLSRIPWFLITPALFFFSVGVKEALVWSLAITAILIHSLYSAEFSVHQLSLPDLKARLLLVFVILCAIAVCAAYFIRSAIQRLFQNQTALQAANRKMKREVSERELMQRALRESEIRLDEILEHSRDILYRRDIETGRYQYISKAFWNLLGFNGTDSKDFVYQGVTDLIHPDDRAHHDAAMANLVRTPDAPASAHTIVYRMRHKDGRYRWFSDNIMIVRDADGKALFTLGTNRDITDQKAAEKALMDAREQLLTILQSIDAHVYVADMKTFEILFMNRKMIDDFGEDLTGRICHDAFRKEDRPCAECTNRQLVDATGRPCGTITWEGKNPVTGNWYINYDRAIKWVDGRLARIQIATDITRMKQLEADRSRAEEQLRQSQKLESIGTLAGGIAHDFNNLLMGIQGSASLGRFELSSSHPVSKRLNDIEAYVKKGAELTRQLLGFARGGKYEVTATDLNALIEDNVRMFGRTRKEIRIETAYQKGLWSVAVDRGQLGQALLNLFVNAAQAMPGGGQLGIMTKNLTIDNSGGQRHDLAPGDYVCVEIADTGIGMDPNTMQRIFDPFFTTKTMGRGTGLGLASVYGIIKNHGGDIFVSSDVGKGATFHLYLPAAETPQANAEPAVEKIVEGSGGILLVDDEEMILDVGRQMLERLGYDVKTAVSGRQALELLRQDNGSIRLVVLDMVMPDMSGEKTFSALKDIRPTVKVLLSSGYSVEGKASEIMANGCDGFIQKPFTLNQLSNKLDEVLP